MKFDIRAVLRALGSRRVATTGMLAWLFLLVIWIVPFEFYGLDSSQLRDIIYGEPFFRLVYALLCVNVVVCISSEIAVIAHRVSWVPSSDRVPVAGEGADLVEGTWDVELATKNLDSAGFTQQVVGDGWIWGVRNRYAPLGHVALHLGLLILVAAALVTMDPGAHISGKAVVVEGETFESVSSQIIEMEPPNAKAPSLKFVVDEIEARFHEDILLFKDLDARITDSSGKKHQLKVGSPWFISPFTMMSLVDYGYASEVVRSREDTTSPSQVFKLKAFPSGTADYFNFRGMDDNNYNVKIQVFGDYIDRGGVPGAKSFNSTNPRFVVTVWRIRSDEGQTMVVKDVLAGLDEPIDLDGHSLTFVGLREYGLFRFDRSLAAPLMALGLIVISTGFCLALLFPRQRVLVVSRDGGLSISVRDDAYRTAPRMQNKLAKMWRSGS